MFFLPVVGSWNYWTANTGYRELTCELQFLIGLCRLVIVHCEHARDDGRKMRPRMNKRIYVGDISRFAYTGPAVCEPGRTCLTGGSRPWRGLWLFSAAERRRFLLSARQHWARWRLHRKAVLCGSCALPRMHHRKQHRKSHRWHPRHAIGEWSAPANQA